MLINKCHHYRDNYYGNWKINICKMDKNYLITTWIIIQKSEWLFQGNKCSRLFCLSKHTLEYCDLLFGCMDADKMKSLIFKMKMDIQFWDLSHDLNDFYWNTSCGETRFVTRLQQVWCNKINIFQNIVMIIF
jgi:hypothetical protein